MKRSARGGTRLDPGSKIELEPVSDKRAFKFLLHSINKTLRDCHVGGILERFDAVSQLLFLKLFDERELEHRRKAAPDVRVDPSDTPRRLFRRLSTLWRRACGQFPSLARRHESRLTVTPDAAVRIVPLLHNLSLVGTSGDVKGVAYEELLRNTFDKSAHQQYFTPHEIVQFMVQLVEPLDRGIICDPACGTGGFLVEALKRTNGRARVLGAEVDERLAHVAQMNLLMHGADNRSAVHPLPRAGSLAPFADIAHVLPPASCSTILTNPPFGSDLLDRRALDGLQTGRHASSRRRSVLFVERCLDLLRPGGKLAIVLDDSVLNLPGNQDIRDLIRARAHVEAVVSLPDVAFMPYSTAKSSILVLRKKGGRATRASIFMADVTQVGRRPNGDPLYSDRRNEDGQRELSSDLPDILSAYRQHIVPERLGSAHCFTVSPAEIEDRLDVFFYHPKRQVAERKLAACKWPTPQLRTLVAPRRDRTNPARDHGDLPIQWLGLADIRERTGEYEIRIVPGFKIHSSANIFRGGDILFSRLRPNLRKVALIPEGDEEGICSGEILVLRLRESTESAQALDAKYLEFILRSDLVYGQLLAHVTGVGRPRVSQDVVLNLRIPVPPLAEQHRLVAMRSEARRLAVEAHRDASHLIAKALRHVAETEELVIAEMSDMRPTGDSWGGAV